MGDKLITSSNVFPKGEKKDKKKGGQFTLTLFVGAWIFPTAQPALLCYK